MKTVTAFHGTKNNYSTFEFGNANLSTYSTGKEGYFSSNEEVAKSYGMVKEYKLNFKKPLVIDFQNEWFSNFHLTNDNNLKLQIWKEVHGYHERYANLLLNSKEALSLDDRILLNHIITFAKNNGYDGIIAHNIVDVAGEVKNEIGTNYIVFNENQILN